MASLLPVETLLWRFERIHEVLEVESYDNAAIFRERLNAVQERLTRENWRKSGTAGLAKTAPMPAACRRSRSRGCRPRRPPCEENDRADDAYGESHGRHDSLRTCARSSAG